MVGTAFGAEVQLTFDPLEEEGVRAFSGSGHREFGVRRGASLDV